MEATIWAKAHGATTHFPIALVLCAGAADAFAFAFPRRPAARELHSAGFWMMLLGALATLPAVFSGLVMTKGTLLGHGAERMHHLYAWPGFALIVGLATWRALSGARATRLAFAVYLIGVAAAGALVAAAGYWGGEMLLGN